MTCNSRHPTSLRHPVHISLILLCSFSREQSLHISLILSLSSSHYIPVSFSFPRNTHLANKFSFPRTSLHICLILNTRRSQYASLLCFQYTYLSFSYARSITTRHPRDQSLHISLILRLAHINTHPSFSTHVSLILSVRTYFLFSFSRSISTHVPHILSRTYQYTCPSSFFPRISIHIPFICNVHLSHLRNAHLSQSLPCDQSVPFGILFLSHINTHFAHSQCTSLLFAHYTHLSFPFSRRINTYPAHSFSHAIPTSLILFLAINQYPFPFSFSQTSTRISLILNAHLSHSHNTHITHSLSRKQSIHTSLILFLAQYTHLSFSFLAIKQYPFSFSFSHTSIHISLILNAHIFHSRTTHISHSLSLTTRVCPGHIYIYIYINKY